MVNARTGLCGFELLYILGAKRVLMSIPKEYVMTDSIWDVLLLQIKLA